MISALKQYNVKVTIFDPRANSDGFAQEYGLVSQKEISNTKFDAVILTIAHTEFKKIDLSVLKKNNLLCTMKKNVFLKMRKMEDCSCFLNMYVYSHKVF